MKLNRSSRFPQVRAVLLGLALTATTFAPQGAFSQGKHIYPAIESGQTDLNAAISQAKREHKRVLVDFGGDWCPDCQVLDVYFHQSPNDELLRKSFVKVNVNIGHIDANQDIAKRCGVPLNKGVPALAVLDGNGKVVYAQAGGEFESMRHLQASDLTAFLNKWKP
jgi:thioredoxin 1